MAKKQTTESEIKVEKLPRGGERATLVKGTAKSTDDKVEVQETHD